MPAASASKANTPPKTMASEAADVFALVTVGSKRFKKDLYDQA